MTSAFAWLDFDDRTRREMMDVIDLFREKGTLDELGIGQIRDTFADRLFPGTSTIQTRARYFLFLPWIYQRIENDASVSDAGKRARKLQYELVKSLKAGGMADNDGVIGINAGESLLRLPAAVYWNGLQRLGIRQINASTEGYHQQLDRRGSRTGRQVFKGDNDELLETGSYPWHDALPPAPNNWLTETTFVLTDAEARFFSERIRMTVGDSLLSACLSLPIGNQASAAFAWELTDRELLSSNLQQVISDAEVFSLLMHGASLTYNLLLARRTHELEISRADELITEYQSRLDQWATLIKASAELFEMFNQSLFWERMRLLNPRILNGSIAFCDLWMERAQRGPHSIADDPAMIMLITRRERLLKGALARLANDRALERWSGAAGTGRLDFRWNAARRIVQDIQAGLVN